jgi:predicted AAA+ superfamily ATPase
MFLARDHHQGAIRRLLRHYPVVALVGPRQVGKSTLARQLAGPRPENYFDLEKPSDIARLQDPFLTLESLKGLVVIDEVQRRPDLFMSLRVLADRRPIRARFLVLGSASPELLQQSSESLAGRIRYYELPPLSMVETDARRMTRLWLRGGFPASFLARNDAISIDWRREFIRSFVTRDLPSLGVRVPPVTMERFWAMLAHYHGQTWNGSEIGRSLALADTTVRSYLDILASNYVVTILRPWHENLAKRQVKTPKVYITDSGLLHSLLDVRDAIALERHPKVGASWEGFMAQQLFVHWKIDRNERYYWRTRGGAELDLLIVRGRERIGFEIKRTTAPTLTPSMRAAVEDLKLQQLWVVHAGALRFPLAARIHAIPATELTRL